MRIVITGGTGMLGSRLAALLLGQGARVRITYRPGDTLAAVEGLDLEHRPADLLDQGALDHALEGMEAVFHMAAMVSFDARRYRDQMRVNIEGTRFLLAAARRAGVRRFIHTSTVNTLGIPPGDTVGDESTPFNWQRYRLGYMDSKREAERLVLAEAERGLDALCLLPGTLFGPGDAHMNTGTYFRMVSTMPFLLASPGGTTAASADNVAQGHMLALERGRAGQRYILGGHPLSYRELFTLIAREMNRKAPVIAVPEALMRVAGKAAGYLQGLGLPLSEGLLVAASSNLYYSSRKAQAELGWRIDPLEPAIRQAWRWYRGKGLL